MRVELDWHNASRADRVLLRRFQCADPATIAFDDERGFECGVGLGSAMCLRVAHLDRYCYIAALGVAHRVSGRGLAGEALDRVHNVMQKYGFHSDYLVDALIDTDNSAAKSAFVGRGYEAVSAEGRYERWARTF